MEEAIRLNNISKVENLIKQGANVNFIFGSKTFQNNTISYENVTPFDYAAILGYAEIAKLLLDAGAFIHPNDYYATHGYVHSGSTLERSGSSSTPNTYESWESWRQQTEEELEKEQENREKIREMINEAMKEEQKK